MVGAALDQQRNVYSPNAWDLEDGVESAGDNKYDWGDDEVVVAWLAWPRDVPVSMLVSKYTL